MLFHHLSCVFPPPDRQEGVLKYFSLGWVCTAESIPEFPLKDGFLVTFQKLQKPRNLSSSCFIFIFEKTELFGKIISLQWEWGSRKTGPDSRGKEIPPLGASRSFSGDSREVTTRDGHSADTPPESFFVLFPTCPLWK